MVAIIFLPFPSVKSVVLRLDVKPALRSLLYACIAASSPNVLGLGFLNDIVAETGPREYQRTIRCIDKNMSCRELTRRQA